MLPFSLIAFYIEIWYFLNLQFLIEDIISVNVHFWNLEEIKKGWMTGLSERKVDRRRDREIKRWRGRIKNKYVILTLLLNLKKYKSSVSSCHYDRVLFKQ